MHVRKLRAESWCGAAWCGASWCGVLPMVLIRHLGAGRREFGAKDGFVT